MSNHRLTRRSSTLLAAAVSSVGMIGFGASQADAGLLIDMRLSAVNGISLDPSKISPDRKTLLNLNVGDTVSMNVVARISGTNAVQSVGNFDGFAPATDTRNDDTMRSLVGAFQSVGGIKGDFDGGNLGNGNQVAPWNAPGATNGTPLDFDSDGDLDLGNTGTDPTNMWAARSAGPQYPTIGKKNTAVQTRFGTGSPWTEDFGGAVGAVPEAKLIDATTGEVLIGELSWIVTGGSGTLAINFVPRANNDAATSLWFEDDITTGKNPSNASFAIGSPITVVPEPTGAALMGLTALGLVARRRKR